MPDEKSIYKMLKRAIRFNKFEFKFKPIYNNRKKGFTKAELQIMIVDSKFGIIDTEIFIKVAEEYGLIHEIGLILLENACKYIELLTKENKGFECIIINISSIQLGDKKFYCALDKILQKYKIDSTKLIIEIKETEGIKNIEELKTIVDVLSNYGIKFAVGKFGVGYSPLDIIKEISLDYIKIDKSILLSSENNKKAKVILKYMFSFAKEIELGLIFEGVEKIEHEDMLKEFGCDYMQGTYLSEDIDFVGLQECFRCCEM